MFFRVAIILFLIIVPIGIDILYSYYKFDFHTTYNPIRIFAHYIFYIVFLTVGAIFGASTMQSERETNSERKLRIDSLVAAVMAVILNWLFNSLFTLYVLRKNNFDPLFIWTLSFSFFITTAYRKRKDTLFYTVFSAVALLLPVLIYFVKLPMDKALASGTLINHIIYFVASMIFAIPTLRIEMKKSGKWHVNAYKIILAVIFLALALTLDSDAVVGRNNTLDYFCIWTITSSFALVTAFYKTQMQEQAQGQEAKK